MLPFGPFHQGLGPRAISFVCWGYLDVQGQLGLGIHGEVNLVAEEDTLLGFMSPTGIVVGVFSWAVALSFTGAGLFAESICVIHWLDTRRNA